MALFLICLFALSFGQKATTSLPPAAALGATATTTFVPRSSFTAPFGGTATWTIPPADRASVYNPNPVPPDPTADKALTSRLTSLRDMTIADKTGDAAQIKAMFDQASFRSFNMEITSDNVDLMKQNPAAEKKVHCRITVDYNTPQARTFGGYGIGCGYKGSVGSLRICLDEYHKDNGNCRKLSIRVDSNAFKLPNVTNPTIYGLKTLLFGGMPVDWSLMSERTAYNLLTSLNIAAPLAAHAKLFLNGKYLGVFSFVQPVDSVFTKINFAKDQSKGKGTLYKDLWFNDVHIKDLAKEKQKDDNFMREVWANVQITPTTPSAAKAFFDKYFDNTSFVDSTAVNTVIGNTDDWRQRHNFYWYVKQDKGGKKLVFVPWDYDRLYDEGASSRGALRGQPWWSIGTDGRCSSAIETPEQQAASLGGSAAMIAYNTDIFRQYPPDLSRPVTCDKIVQLMAAALGDKIRAVTLDLAKKISITKIKQNWATWTAQIQTAVTADPDGPSISAMLDEQKTLEKALINAEATAVRQAQQGNSSTSGYGVSTPAAPSGIAPPPFSKVGAGTWVTAGTIGTPGTWTRGGPAAPATAPVAATTLAGPASTPFSTFFPPITLGAGIGAGR